MCVCMPALSRLVARGVLGNSPSERLNLRKTSLPTHPMQTARGAKDRRERVVFWGVVVKRILPLRPRGNGVRRLEIASLEEKSRRRGRRTDRKNTPVGRLRARTSHGLVSCITSWRRRAASWSPARALPPGLDEKCMHGSHCEVISKTSPS